MLDIVANKDIEIGCDYYSISPQLWYAGRSIAYALDHKTGKGVSSISAVPRNV